MEMLIKIQVNIPFCEVLVKMSTYTKFMKELLSRKKKFKDDENFVLAKECSSIIQRKLPLKLTDPGRFTIPCTIGPLFIGQSLCDLETIMNLMPLSMIKKLNYGEPKPTRMTLTLAIYLSLT